MYLYIHFSPSDNIHAFSNEASKITTLFQTTKDIITELKKRGIYFDFF